MWPFNHNHAETKRVRLEHAKEVYAEKKEAAYEKQRKKGEWMRHKVLEQRRKH